MIPYGRQTIEEDDIEEVVKVLKSDFLTTGPKVADSSTPTTSPGECFTTDGRSLVT